MNRDGGDINPLPPSENKSTLRAYVGFIIDSLRDSGYPTHALALRKELKRWEHE